MNPRFQDLPDVRVQSPKFGQGPIFQGKNFTVLDIHGPLISQRGFFLTQNGRVPYLATESSVISAMVLAFPMAK